MRLPFSRRVLLPTAVVVALGGVGLAVASRAWTPPLAPQAAPEAMYVCPMHPDVRQATEGRCPICGMALERESPDEGTGAHADAHGGHAVAANPARPGVEPGLADDPAGARAPLTIDGRRQQLLGVRIVPAQTETLERAVRAVGEVRADESRWTDVNVRIEGWVRELTVDRTGQYVRRGQPLLTLYSPDLVTAQSEYLLAVRARDALGPSASPGAKAQAEALVDAARQRLDRWEMPESEFEALGTEGAPPVTLFRAPASGVVMEKRVVQGQRVMPGETLYRLLDLSRVWVEAEVFEADLPLVKVGQAATVSLDALPGREWRAKVTYVYPTVETETRTGRVRLSLPNGDGVLRPGAFATVSLQATAGRGVTVPVNALLDAGTRQYVFVSDGQGYFEPRGVRAGARADGRVLILEGLEAGEQVASGANFFLDSESQLRAALEGIGASGAPPAAAPAARGPRLEIGFRTEPDPPRAGPAQIEVTVRAPDGAPVTDAEVAVTLYMPPMPSMNMPAMRSEAVLGHAGGGVYRGTGDVMMSGRWDVTVAVTRGGARLATHQTSFVAR